MIIEPNKIVYMIYNNTVEKGKIKELCHDIIYVKHICMTNTDGTDSYSCPGTSAISKTDLFDTCDAAYTELNRRFNESVTQYMNEINSIEDLIRFPLIHNFGCEEYTDSCAITAYKTMAAKFGFNIDIAD